MLDYISVEQASEKWGISKRRIQKLCEENRIDGVIRFDPHGQFQEMRKNQRMQENRG
ncbi:hypothetical protein [Anaerocolumna jejuensis]|uniref:hypothetical protein n=1 Tax=Anaerocolumna jejuensis TaxID=259063 RepID=UPI003F7B869E